MSHIDDNDDDLRHQRTEQLTKIIYFDHIFSFE